MAELLLLDLIAFLSFVFFSEQSADSRQAGLTACCRFLWAEPRFLRTEDAANASMLQMLEPHPIIHIGKAEGSSKVLLLLSW